MTFRVKQSPNNVISSELLTLLVLEFAALNLCPTLDIANRKRQMLDRICGVIKFGKNGRLHLQVLVKKATAANVGVRTVGRLAN